MFGGALVPLYVVLSGVVAVSPPPSSPVDRLDTSFAASGLRVTHLGAEDVASAVTAHPDGGVVVAGMSAASLAVARYTAHGVLHPDFGARGVVTFSDLQGVASVVAVDRAGRIVVVSMPDGVQEAPVRVVRLLADGRRDPTFGHGGAVTIDKVDGENLGGLHFNDVAITDDDAIMLVGRNGIYGEDGYGASAIVRLDWFGRPDPGFDGDGGRMYWWTAGEFWGAASSMGGGVIAAGSCAAMCVVKVNRNATLDRSFGRSGRRSAGFGDRSAFATDLALDSRGRAVVVGHVKGSFLYDERPRFGMARFTADGTLDRTFGTGGRVYEEAREVFAGSVAIASDGRIMVAGERRHDGDYEPFVRMYLPDGKRDSEFGVHGELRPRFGGRDDILTAASVDAFGRGLIVGATTMPQTGQDMAIVAYTHR